jgi:molybdate transport system permease protein
MSLEPLWLGLRYAVPGTVLAVLAGLPLAWFLAHRTTGVHALDAFVNLPLALPPAVLCYFLIAPRRFDWNVAVALSAIYTLPLVAAMARAGLEAVDHDAENAARTLGASEWRVFWRITWPLAWRDLAAAVIAAFARAWADCSLTAIAAAPRNEIARAPALLLLGATVWGAFYLASRLRRGRAWA